MGLNLRKKKMFDNKIKFVVPGKPQGKLRAKWVKVGKFGVAHTPQKTVNYENFIKQMFVEKYPKFVPVDCELHLFLEVWQAIPKGTSIKKTELMVGGGIRPAKLPDIDNILKSVMDALEGLAYQNDNQFVSATIDKLYSRRPRLEITIKY